MDVVLVEEHRLPTMAVVVEAGDEPREPIQGFPEDCPEDVQQVSVYIVGVRGAGAGKQMI